MLFNAEYLSRLRTELTESYLAAVKSLRPKDKSSEELVTLHRCDIRPAIKKLKGVLEEIESLGDNE